MLKSIDVLLGVTVVMLIVSALVTALTQLVLYLQNARGETLREGIGDLMGQIAPEFSRECREHIAKTALLHPLVRAAKGRLSSAIHREDLMKLLLELSSRTEGEHVLEPQHRASLISVLERNGIKDPGRILDNVQSLTLQLELAKPELSSTMRANIALIQEANSQFLAKMHAWFDQTIDRSIDRFTASARTITYACAFAVAFAIQLDTRDLVNRLSTNDALRARLVEEAIKIDAAGPPATPAPPPNVNEALDRIRQQRAAIDELAESGAVDIPSSATEWKNRWTWDNWFQKLVGILLSTVLLGFGAPFWYNMLKNLLKLRSVVAAKDDDQRQDRQTVTTGPGSSPQPSTLTATSAAGAGELLQGERGFIGTAG